MEPVSRSTNGTPALAPAGDPGAPKDAQEPAEPATPAERASAAPTASATTSAPAESAPSDPGIPSTDPIPPSSDPPAPEPATPAPAATSPQHAVLGAPTRTPAAPGKTWWGGPMRSARPLDRLSGLSQALVGDAILRHVAGRRVLDLGNGSPEIARWVRPLSASLDTVDLRLCTTDAGEIRLPQADARYDVVYSLRTLAHLGHDEASSDLGVRSLLAEAARVLVPGGVVLVDINNPRSLRGLSRTASVAPSPSSRPAASSTPTARHHVTRYDTSPACCASPRQPRHHRRLRHPRPGPDRPRFLQDPAARPDIARRRRMVGPRQLPARLRCPPRSSSCARTRTPGRAATYGSEHVTRVVHVRHRLTDQAESLHIWPAV
jgi:SAM-dependent methyltransferase